MARNIYGQKQAGAAIQLWADSEVDKYVRADIQDRIADIQAVLALDADQKALLGQAIPSIGGVNFFDTLEAELEDLQDLNEYFDYATGAVEITAFLSDWLAPDTVEAFPGEDVVDDHLKMINGVNSDFWAWTGGAPPYVIDFKMRDWRKRVTGLRLRNTDGDLRASLQDVQVYGANTIPNLDSASERFTVPFSMTSGPGTAGWQSFTFDNPLAGTFFLRLEIGGTEHASDQIRIRELNFEVGVRDLGV